MNKRQYMAYYHIGLLPTSLPWEYQGLSQDLETGRPKLAIVKVFGFLFFKRDHNTQITTIKMYFLIEIRYDILWIYSGVKKKLFENDILRNYSQKLLEEPPQLMCWYRCRICYRHVDRLGLKINSPEYTVTHPHPVIS